MFKVFGCITQQHDLRLVGLAACICAIACFTTLTLLARTDIARSLARPRRVYNIWLIAAAIVFGAGIWSLHFVAMLAFMPSVPVTYNVPITVLSICLAMFGAFLSFATWHVQRRRHLGAVYAGILVGLTVSAMHYCGIAAMQPPGRMVFDWAEVGGSVVAGMALGVLAMLRAHKLASLKRRAEVSGLLALAICGVHFTGMTALSLEPGLAADTHGSVSASGPLALAVGLVSLAILIVSLAATLLEQHLTQRKLLDLGRIRLLSSLSHEVMMIHRNGVILEINEAGSRMFGLRTAELIGARVLDLFAEPDRATVAKRLRPVTDVLDAMEVAARTAAGRLVPVEISSSGLDYEGKPAIAMAVRDLSDRKRNEEQIRHLAHHDALTDLPNRFLLKDRLTHALDEASCSGDGVALLYLDLDRFKPVNDLLGHAGGDAVLVQVARRLRGELRASDTLARIGGDEFVIVLPIGKSPRIATALALRVIGLLARPFDILGREVEIGASIGIALYPAHGATQEALIAAADTALYRVKQDGRGTFRLYEPAMDAQLQDRSRLDQDLRHAVVRRELVLHYQPVLNCKTQDVDGFEALIRWQHPERGLLYPADFIALAEETGQIIKLGEWAIQAACEAAALWPGSYTVAVNVSPTQLRQPDFAATVGGILQRTGLEAERLEIEVTESVFIGDSSSAIDMLSALHAQGVRVALDDFGTGYSSLSYLRSFAFDTLKIDRSFISSLDQKALDKRLGGKNDDAAMIVRAIIGLGHNLGLSITAEGIETPQQRAMLESLGCDHLQGYLLGRPMAHPPALMDQPQRLAGSNVVSYKAQAK